LFEPQVKSDVANEIVSSTLPKALTEKNIVPISQPEVTVQAVDPAAPFSFTATFEVQPVIDSVTFEGFELYRPKADVEEALVDSQIESLRLRHAALKAPEPARAAAKGDLVTIDFTLTIDGREVKDGGGQGVTIELGAKQALPEIDAALTGKSVQDAATADHAFPAEHPREDFRGKTGTFAITVTDVKERILPTLDDEFAKDVGFETLVALRADVHSKLEKVAKERAEASLAEQIVDHLNAKNACEVPPSLVDQQARLMMIELLQTARRMGNSLDPEQFEAVRRAVLPDAEKKVRAGLLMAAIARQHQFKVTDEDIEKGLAQLAEESGKNVAKVRAEYREKAKRDMLIGMILEDKILDFIETKSTIVDGEPPVPAPQAPAAVAGSEST